MPMGAPPGFYCSRCFTVPVSLSEGCSMCSRWGAGLCELCDHCEAKARQYPFPLAQTKGQHFPFRQDLAPKCSVPTCQQTAKILSINAPALTCCDLEHMYYGHICAFCKVNMQNEPSEFCSQSCWLQFAQVPRLWDMDCDVHAVRLLSILGYFDETWERSMPSDRPKVRKVYMLATSVNADKSYWAYRNFLELRSEFQYGGMAMGNEVYRWHGTRRACNLGDSYNHENLCAQPTCSLCNIIRNSFDLGFANPKNGWGRFGRGIYSTATSSKADQYSSNACASRFKALILCKVAAGNMAKCVTEAPTLTRSPPGFDSILAEPDGSVEDDELVVYRNEAIKPAYLVIYEPVT
ncbi:hypothetical protein EV715DRAFT_245105 [Schizophyllum commune]